MDGSGQAKPELHPDRVEKRTCRHFQPRPDTDIAAGQLAHEGPGVEPGERFRRLRELGRLAAVDLLRRCDLTPRRPRVSMHARLELGERAVLRVRPRGESFSETGRSHASFQYRRQPASQPPCAEPSQRRSSRSTVLGMRRELMGLIVSHARSTRAVDRETTADVAEHLGHERDALEAAVLVQSREDLCGRPYLDDVASSELVAPWRERRQKAHDCIVRAGASRVNRTPVPCAVQELRPGACTLG